MKEYSASKVLFFPEQDQWRVKYLARILEERRALHYEGDREGEERVSALIDSFM